MATTYPNEESTITTSIASDDVVIKEDVDPLPELGSDPPSLTDLPASAGSGPVRAGSASSSESVEEKAIDVKPTSATPAIKRKKNSSKGRHGDPRMHRAVAARLLNPELSLLESLLEGGFTFPEGTEGSGKSDRNIYDSDGVLLCQRKNQLSRRLRLAKKRQQASRSEGGMYASGVAQKDSDSRTIQNMLLNGQLPIAGSNEQVPVPMMPTHQLGGFFVPTPAAPKFDTSAMQGNDPQNKGAMEQNNFNQYIQLAMGLRPDQIQALRYSGNMNMFPAYPTGPIPFQPFAMQPQTQNFLGAAMDPSQAAGLNAGMNLQNMQNMQMNPMMAMPPTNAQAPGQAQMNADLNRLLLGRSMMMNPNEADNENGQKS
eukprot:CAMPEP_0204616286 /NCGR_PEP_ID=MMETSP0717-20131115/3566_1 /ASSEMBLY_ACC=CAM_ASM_000666 /TAXON_ID=230516 /ORGANISM="Chaetoceros curvisetus" /LENGTH=370 /DNA_ID=CAMNT_0051629475 /DNA_START=109 /DNA_END=1221 /DNA_ORIENTATION=-